MCAMRAAILTPAIALACLVTLAGQTFRTRVDLVHVGVTVLEKRGSAYITDLTQDDFEIYEDGKKQTIKYFSRGDDAAAAKAELHLGVLFDTSGSMDADLKLSRSAAVKFLNALPEAADITLVDFDTEVRVARYGQADFPRLVERLRKREADGWTALYDAMGVYLDGAFNQDGRKVLVMCTDGGDTRSQLTFSDLTTLLKSSDVTVHAVGLLEHQPSSTKLDQRMKLQQIAEMTGGQAFFPTDEKQLDDIYAKIVADMNAQYSLGYVSTNTKMDGSWRKVEIKVTRTGVKDPKLRTRKGYFAPYKETPKP
jgi:Ca-activated chloride channel homolog